MKHLIKFLILLSVVLLAACGGDEWDRSSLYFGASCEGDCDEITATVCNGDDSEDMDGPSTWELYWIATGNPKDGVVIASGTIDALAAGECQVLTYDPGDNPNGASGNYMFKAYQRPGHRGTGELWSDACELDCPVCADADGDGVCDKEDNCPDVYNPDQADADGDGVGDACDGCPDDPNKTEPGICGCGVADTDSDGDGTADCNDNCPDVYNPDQADADGDGVGDACDGCPDDPNKTHPSLEWVDGYWLAFRQKGTSYIELRYFVEGQWKEATDVRASGATESWGVGLASELGGLRSVLGYNQKGDKLFIHDGLALLFGVTPGHEMDGVISAPAIIHTGDSEFLIAYQAQDDTVHLRPYNPGPGFGNQIALSVEGNDHVLNRPTIAYHNGRLVVVWARWIGCSSNSRFRYVAADYQPGDNTITIVATGEMSGIPELQADPALTHDGAGLFYLAVLRRSGCTGLTSDQLSIYSSPDGMTWTVFHGGVPKKRWYTGLTNVDIAAQPSGEILLAVTTTENGYRVGRVFRFLSGSGWTELGASTAFKGEPFYGSFSLIRSQYLTRRCS